MSLVIDKKYSSYVNNEKIDYSKLPFDYLETKPTQFINNTPKSFWQPGVEKNNEILNNNRIKNNSDYRKYMTNNSASIIAYNNKTFSLEISKD